MVLSDKEADKRVTEYIKDSVWAFRPEFIIDHSNLPDEAIEMVQSFQETKSDGANETILSLIIDIKDFYNTHILTSLYSKLLLNKPSIWPSVKSNLGLSFSNLPKSDNFIGAGPTQTQPLLLLT